MLQGAARWGGGLVEGKLYSTSQASPPQQGHPVKHRFNFRGCCGEHRRYGGQKKHRNNFNINFLPPTQISETGRIRFQRVRFQTPNSVSFFGLTEFWGPNSVSSFRPIICVQTQTHRVSRRTHRVCRRTQ